MEKLKKLWNLCGGYLLLILCGAVLVLFPDSAVALVTKLLAWILVIAGVWNVIKNLAKGSRGAGDWIWPVLYLLVGIYMLSNPLIISEMAGRVLGLILMLQGVNDLRRSRYESARVLGGVTVLAGLVLMLIPRTLINTLLALVGIVLIVIGLINCADRLRHGRQLDEGSDPNIIDADE